MKTLQIIFCVLILTISLTIPNESKANCSFVGPTNVLEADICFFDQISSGRVMVSCFSDETDITYASLKSDFLSSIETNLDTYCGEWETSEQGKHAQFHGDSEHLIISFTTPVAENDR